MLAKFKCTTCASNNKNIPTIPKLFTNQEKNEIKANPLIRNRALPGVVLTH